jgi:hypothetical protein
MEEEDGGEPRTLGLRLNQDHPFGKQSTDQVILDFGNLYPTIVEYGNLAIATLINKRITDVFYASVKFLDKKDKKTISKRFDFLVDNTVKCIPLSAEIISTSMNLLTKFTEKYNLKANFRNSLNDILILATAIESSALLFTEDSLLNEFAAAEYAGNIEKKDACMTVDFIAREKTQSRKRSDSKGYINRGWQARFINYGNSNRSA